MRRLVIPALFFASLLLGCPDSGEAPVPPSPSDASTEVPAGEPYFVARDSSSSTMVRELALDFGTVLVGRQSERTVTLYNAGTEPLQVVGLVLSENADGAFGHDFVPLLLAPGANQQIALRFAPLASGARSSTATLSFQGADVATLSVTLSGAGEQSACPELPARLDLGAVEPGQSFRAAIQLENPRSTPLSVFVHPPAGADGASFLLSGLASGEHTLPAAGSLSIPIEFAPLRLGGHAAELTVDAGTDCAAQTISLVGEGAARLLTVEPARLNFDFVRLGMSRSLSVTVRNLGNVDLPLSELGFSAAATFAFTAPEGQVAVPAHGSLELPVVFTPDTPERSTGELSFRTGDPAVPTVTVALEGWGGGPIIDVLPAALDLGITAVGGERAGTLVVSNQGPDSPGTAIDNLAFLARDSFGNWSDAQPEIVSATPDEFTLDWPPAGYTALGLASGQEASITVRFAPASAGRKQAVVRLPSNDRYSPVREITVSAEASTLPTCNYEVIGTSLDFGDLGAGRSRTLSFYVRNLSANPADTCTFSAPRLTAASDAQFSLPGAASGDTTIPGGAVHEVRVAFSPTRTGLFDGVVELWTSSTSAPDLRVPLLGSSGQSCLTLLTDAHDFGQIGVGCASRPLTVVVQNTCSTAAELAALDFQAGLPAGFSIVQQPALPAALPAAGSLELQVAFEPLALDEVTASLELRFSQSARPLVLTLAGEGASTSVRTDTFDLDEQRKVDVLLIVDDSCSMSDKQMALGNAFGSFIGYADSHQIDYHLAVTTTSVGTGSDFENGRLVPLSGGNPRVITPSTPNKASVFAQNVYVGTSGDAYEKLIRPAYLALSEPLASGHNAGFRRADANLSIVILSDAADQDSTALTYYQQFLTGVAGGRRLNLSGFVPKQANEPFGSCSYDEATAGQSLRVRDLISRTGGVAEEICNGDWPSAAARVGEAAFGIQPRLFLSEIPAPSAALAVRVDGQLVPATSSAGDVYWTYDPDQNSIDFSVAAMPEPGAVVTVTYQAECH